MTKEEKAYENRKAVYQAALDKWGAEVQTVVAIEEMSEVQKELCKALRGNADFNHVAEEIADATIMLEQMRLMFDLNDLVHQKMDEKMHRLYQRLEGANA